MEDQFLEDFEKLLLQHGNARFDSGYKLGLKMGLIKGRHEGYIEGSRQALNTAEQAKRRKVNEN